MTDLFLKILSDELHEFPVQFGMNLFSTVSLGKRYHARRSSYKRRSHLCTVDRWKPVWSNISKTYRSRCLYSKYRNFRLRYLETVHKLNAFIARFSMSALFIDGYKEAHFENKTKNYLTDMPTVPELPYLSLKKRKKRESP